MVEGISGTKYTNYVYPAGNSAPVTIPQSFKSYGATLERIPEQDTVVIKKPEEKGLSKGAKWILGITGAAAAIYGCIVGHRMLTRPSIEKVAQNFSEIFRKNIGVDEAQKMASRYKEIFKIKDNKEFQNTLFEQVKKDYGLENTAYELSIEKLRKHESGHFSPFGKIKFLDKEGMTTVNFDSKGCIAVDEVHAKSREAFFSTIIHELNHAKQFEIAYKTDSVKALNSYFSRLEIELPFINELKQQKNFDLISELTKVTKEFLGTTPANSLKMGTKEYELGLKYINGNKNYIQADKNPKGYVEQFVEKESFNVQKLMDKCLNNFLSPWRIF